MSFNVAYLVILRKTCCGFCQCCAVEEFTAIGTLETALAGCRFSPVFADFLPAVCFLRTTLPGRGAVLPSPSMQVLALPARALLAPRHCSSVSTVSAAGSLRLPLLALSVTAPCADRVLAAMGSTWVT